MKEELTILEAKQHSIIPEYLWHCIQDKCLIEDGGCGELLMTTRILSRQWCPNPRCRKKIIARAVKTINRFGYIGVGPSFFKKFFECNPKYISHVDIFNAHPDEFFETGEIEATKDFLNIRDKILSEKYLFSEVVANLAFPEIDTSARVIFDQFESLQMFEKYLEINNLNAVKYISSLYGFSTKSAKAVEKTLKDFRYDLLYIPKIFKIKKYAKRDLVIAITGETNYHYMTKKEFIAHLNRLGNEKVHVTFTSTALQSCDYIVCSGANDYRKDSDGNYLLDADGDRIIVPGSIKKNIGIARNKREGEKILVTPVEMKEIVKNLVKEIEANGK